MRSHEATPTAQAAALDPTTVHAKFVLALFDQTTDALIRDTWQQLSEKGIKTPIDDLEPPHISLGGVELLDVAGFQLALASEFPTLEIPARISHIGAFGSGNFLWLGCAATDEILRLHRAVDSGLQTYSSQAPDSMYRPNFWVPHSTLARDVRPHQMADFWSVVESLRLPHDATLRGFQIVDVEYPRS